ncbi:MAG: hypothetical protein HY545_00945, partial [Candidatus Doudnabacteria bacterium]|nr:hypothetical protein [Candidatus Doudnabacteria bacterium]
MRYVIALKQNKKIAVFAALGLVAALAVTFVAVSRASHLDVNYSWINDNDVNCHPAGSVVNGGVWTAEIRNNGPEDIFIEKAAFHDPQAGCSATTHTLRQDVFSMSGETHYSVGETNRTTFTYNVGAFNCGRVQIDAAYRSATGSGDGFVFLGEMINYGVDCPSTIPPAETGRIRVINKEVNTNRDIFACWTLVRENPPQRWTDQCAVEHTYANFPFGRYTIEVQPGITHDFDHVDPVGWQNLGSGTPGGLIQWIVYWRPKAVTPPPPPPPP